MIVKLQNREGSFSALVAGGCWHCSRAPRLVKTAEGGGMVVVVVGFITVDTPHHRPPSKHFTLHTVDTLLITNITPSHQHHQPLAGPVTGDKCRGISENRKSLKGYQI